MTSPVEIPLLCEQTGVHAPTSAPEFEPDLPRHSFSDGGTSSRELPISSFDPLACRAVASREGGSRSTRTIDYWEFHRVLDSIEARLQELKRDAGLAPRRAVASREGG